MACRDPDVSGSTQSRRVGVCPIRPWRGHRVEWDMLVLTRTEGGLRLVVWAVVCDYRGQLPEQRDGDGPIADPAGLSGSSVLLALPALPGGSFRQFHVITGSEISSSASSTATRRPPGAERLLSIQRSTRVQQVMVAPRAHLDGISGASPTGWRRSARRPAGRPDRPAPPRRTRHQFDLLDARQKVLERPYALAAALRWRLDRAAGHP